jgi:hypothetical protein
VSRYTELRRFAAKISQAVENDSEINRSRTRGKGRSLISQLAVPAAGAGFMPAGVADGDLFRLKKFGNLNLRGVGEATGVGVGLGDASAAVFLRGRFAFGEAAGDSAAEGGVAVSVGEVASVFLCARCFSGKGDSGVNSCD